MNNEIFLNQMKNLYESLNYFSFEGNILVLNYNGIYKIPFNNVQLSNIDPNLFLLSPNEIFHILRMLELLPKKELNQDEIDFAIQYVNRYLTMNDLSLEKDDIDKNKVWCFSIPIYSSYYPEYINNPISNIIQNIINNHSNEIENSKGNHPRLVLTNPNFEQVSTTDYMTDLGKAGFTTLIIIATAVVSTILYIANFIIGS